jgi:hypothetical protein
MNERAKLLKVTAIVASIFTILCLIFIVIICIKYGFTIYPYIGLLLSFVSCIKLWKSYIDEKKHNRKLV